MVAKDQASPPPGRWRCAWLIQFGTGFSAHERVNGLMESMISCILRSSNKFLACQLDDKAEVIGLFKSLFPACQLEKKIIWSRSLLVPATTNCGFSCDCLVRL